MGMVVFFYRNEMMGSYDEEKSHRPLFGEEDGGKERERSQEEDGEAEKQSSSSIWIVPDFGKNRRRFLFLFF